MRAQSLCISASVTSWQFSKNWNIQSPETGSSLTVSGRYPTSGQPTFGPPIRFEAPTPQGAVDYPGSSGGRIGAGKDSHCALPKKHAHRQKRCYNLLDAKV